MSKRIQSSSYLSIREGRSLKVMLQVSGTICVFQEIYSSANLEIYSGGSAPRQGQPPGLQQGAPTQRRALQLSACPQGHRLTVYGNDPYSSQLPINTATSRYHGENQDDTIPKIAQHHHRSASSRVIPSSDRRVTLLSGPTESEENPVRIL